MLPGQRLLREAPARIKAHNGLIRFSGYGDLLGATNSPLIRRPVLPAPKGHSRVALELPMQYGLLAAGVIFGLSAASSTHTNTSSLGESWIMGAGNLSCAPTTSPYRSPPRTV